MHVDIFRNKLFSLIELTGQSYESFMNMPYGFFEAFFEWKSNMVKEQNVRNKKELEAQQQNQRKLKAQQDQANTKNRIKAEYSKSPKKVGKM